MFSVESLDGFADTAHITEWHVLTWLNVGGSSDISLTWTSAKTTFSPTDAVLLKLKQTQWLYKTDSLITLAISFAEKYNKINKHS